MLRKSLKVFKSGQQLCCLNRLKLHTSIFPVLYPRFDKDLPNPVLYTPTSKLIRNDTDILMEQFKKSKTLDRVLELVNMHIDVMNSRHVVASLECIHIFIKEDATMARFLLENMTFQSLCSRLMKVIRLFDPQECITTFKLLSALQIRNNTYVMQSVLKMIGAHINNMNLSQLTFLNFLLNKQRHGSLVDGLKLALPLVLQVQIEQQLNSDNITEAVDCLQLACRSRLKLETIEKVLRVVKQKASVLSTNNAVTVIFALLNLDAPVDGYRELINAAFDIVSRNIDDISQTKIHTILRTCQNQHFYHTTFFFTVADHIVAKKWNLEMTYLTLSYFHKLQFCPANLLDHFAERLCSESEHFITDNLYSSLNCIEYLTATSYRATHIDEAARVLYSEKKKLDSIEKIPNLYIKFLSSLAMLGHFPQSLLSKALDEDFLYSSWSCSKKQGKQIEYERNILSLLWSLEIYDEKKNFNIPISILRKIFQTIHQKHMNSDYPLEKCIESGLGGSQFLRSGVFTHDGHFIDHIVAMRSGNYPVSLEHLKPKGETEKSFQDLVFVDDFVLPEDAKIIAIILAGGESYCRDPEILKGWMDLKVRSLAKRNYSTVVINHTLWKDLPDREKIPFLMHEIKQAVPEECVHKTIYR